jgi:hypothetical protein
MRNGDQIPWREVVVSIVGGIGIPVVASLVLPALPKGARLPVGLAIGGIVLVAGALYGLRSLRRQIAASEQLLLSSLEGYQVDSEAGALLKGNISNVSLRRTTLHDMIDGIAQAVDSERRASLLYEIGHATGESWGRDFETECRRAKLGATDLKSKLALWADYDASAGMGRLSFDLAQDGEGAAVVANSFLSDSPAATPLNHWFSGYLAGTLSHLLGHEVAVTLVDPTPQRQLVTTFHVAPA